MIIPIRRVSHFLGTRAQHFLGLNQDTSAAAGRGTRIGLFVSGAFLVSVGLLIVLVSSVFVVLAIPTLLFGGYNLVNSRRKKLSLSRSNLLSLSGHLCATLVLYILLTRILWVTYMTDSIVGSYMGVLKILALQNPYGYSIKPFLDQFGFSPSFYTPRVDGSFEFHLNYPALNFLSLLPLYAVGLHDLRDGVFVFHILSVLVIFGLVPSRQKALSLAPFIFFPAFVASSWTDSVWAFFLLGGTVLWDRNSNIGVAMVGLAGSSTSLLRRPNGAGWHGVTLSLRDAILEIEVLRLDLPRPYLVLLLSIISKLHLLLVASTGSRILHEQAWFIDLALFAVQRHCLAPDNSSRFAFAARQAKSSAACRFAAYHDICRSLWSLCFQLADIQGRGPDRLSNRS